MELGSCTLPTWMTPYRLSKILPMKTMKERIDVLPFVFDAAGQTKRGVRKLKKMYCIMKTVDSHVLCLSTMTLY